MLFVASAVSMLIMIDGQRRRKGEEICSHASIIGSEWHLFFTFFFFHCLGGIFLVTRL